MVLISPDCAHKVGVEKIVDNNVRSNDVDGMRLLTPVRSHLTTEVSTPSETRNFCRQKQEDDVPCESVGTNIQHNYNSYDPS